MALRIDVEKSGNNVVLRAPEHPLVAERAAALGGKPKGRDWVFPAAKESQARALARELWGTDGSDKATATIRVELSLYGEGPMGRIGEAWLCGRLLARRRSFDGPAELGEGVKLVSGSFANWGGSPGRPALGAKYGTVVDVSDVPLAAARAAEKEYPFEVKVVQDGQAQVGAWSRSITERIPGPLQRADAKMGGKERKSAAPAAKAASKPAPAPKAAAPAPAPNVAKKAEAVAKQVSKKAVAAAKKVAAKAKVAAKKVVTRAQAVAKKVAAKKAAPKKAAPKKAAPKKPAKKAPARKAAPKKAAPKKAAPKKAVKKAPARKPAPKKAAPKKAAKKAPARKKATRRGRR